MSITDQNGIVPHCHRKWRAISFVTIQSPQADIPRANTPQADTPSWQVYFLNALAGRHTPPGRQTPPGRHPLPPGRPLQRTVRIILECILVN